MRLGSSAGYDGQARWAEDALWGLEYTDGLFWEREPSIPGAVREESCAAIENIGPHSR